MRRPIGLFLVVGIGVGLVAVHLGHALGEDESIRTFLLGILVPMLFAGGVFVGGVWLWQRDIDDSHVLRVGIWCLFGATLLAMGGGLVILYQRQYGVVMDEQLFVVLNGASGGAFVGLFVGVYDTRQQRAQARVDRLNRQLTVLNRVLRHDIRNNANVIQGNAELLTRDSVDTARTADTIKRQATDLVELGERAKQIERVLDREGKQRRVVEVTSVVEGCCEQVRRDYPAAEIETSLPETEHVLAHQLVESALANVIENAVEHNDKETPLVTVESQSVSQDGTEYVEIRVADNGPGIAESEITALERGYETELEHSSGLGLWLVNWIVTSVDGEIRFEENDPEGSIVSLRLKGARERSVPLAESNTVGSVG